MAGIERLGLNPIAIDTTDTRVCYGSIHGDDIRRIRARDLANPPLSATIST